MGKGCALLKGSTEHSDWSLASFQWLQMHLKRAVITHVSCNRTCPQTCLGKNLLSPYLGPVFALLTRS